MTRRMIMAVGVVVSLMTVEGAIAQPLGQFRWQLLPFCNVVTLNVVQTGGVYALDGFDDQCGGAAPRAAAVGTAFPNPAGTIGMGLTIVTSPSGTPLHVDVSLNLATVSGVWHDSGGHAGTFAFTPGAPVPGSVRPPSRTVFPVGLSVAGTTITNVASPVNVTDAANRAYVDGAAPVTVLMAGSGLRTILPPVQLSLGSTTFATPRSGFLKIEMMVTGGLGCDTGGSTRWWIELDGAPVRSSVKSVGETLAAFDITGFPAISLMGITATPIPAGNHAAVVRIGCVSGIPNSASASLLFTGVVTVLSSNYIGASADVPAAADQPAADCLVQRTADGAERRVCR